MKYYALYTRADVERNGDNYAKCIGVIKCDNIQSDLFSKSETANIRIMYDDCYTTNKYYSKNIQRFVETLRDIGALA